MNILKSVERNKVDFYEKYLINHHFRVANLCKQFAYKLNLDEKKTFILIQSALLHDVGKLGIPEDILMKKEELTSYELCILRSHSITGASYLKDKGFPEEIVKTVEYHHERIDGEGYPYGVLGENIPFLSKILAVCDAYDAMTAGRHYKKRLSIDKALKELSMNLGTQFDSDVVDKFISILHKKEEVKVV